MRARKERGLIENEEKQKEEVEKGYEQHVAENPHLKKDEKYRYVPKVSCVPQVFNTTLMSKSSTYISD